MSASKVCRSRIPSPILSIVVLVSIVGIAAAFISCGGTSSSSFGLGTGTMNVTLTDPPSCAFPSGNFDHVYISIRSVQGHTSATATDSTPGWQELAPQLNSAPMQVDLLGPGVKACLLATLGSNTSLPVGTYQQFRLILVPNNGSGGAVPSTNACGNNGFNCAILHDGTVEELLLSSQANTGLKIPPGQVVGGPVTVNAGQAVDLNIDFNICASMVQEGNGGLRLKPVLTAGQVSTNNTGISGQVVDAATGGPLVGGTVLVALEQQDASGNDTIFMQAAADSAGNFTFCPLPAGATFDVVVVGINGLGTAYNATVAVGIPGGTSLGKIPLNAETGASLAPATFTGFVTAVNGTNPASIDAATSALQSITVNSVARLVTIPAESGSTPVVSVQSNATCPAGAPANANCAQYTLVEPASNPSVGTFSNGSISYSTPAAGNVLYTIKAIAAVPLSGGTPDCTPSTMTTNQDATSNPLKATGGATTKVKEIDFSGCSL